MSERHLKDILEDVRALAVEFYRKTGRPLGVTGEFAEAAAAEVLDIVLAPVRQVGFDATCRTTGERIQIKGRAVSRPVNNSAKLGRIRPDIDCDSVLLVLLSKEELLPIGMWKAPVAAVLARLETPGAN